MQSRSVFAAKLVIAATFLFMLGVTAVVYMDSVEPVGQTAVVLANAEASSACVDCHTNPLVIGVFASPVEEAVGGG